MRHISTIPMQTHPNRLRLANEWNISSAITMQTIVRRDFSRRPAFARVTDTLTQFPLGESFTRYELYEQWH